MTILTPRAGFHAVSLRSLCAAILAMTLLSTSHQATATEERTNGSRPAAGTVAEEPVTESAAAQTDAKARYELGVKAYRERRFEDAIELFLAADRLVPRPALAFNVARAYEKLNEPARALQYYREYLRRGADASNREEVALRVRELQAALAKRGVQQITVRSQPSGASVAIDGKLRGTTPWTGELPIGTHQLQAQQHDRQTVSVTLTLEASRAQNLELVLPAASRAPTQQPALTDRLGSAHAAANLSATSEQSADGGLQPWPWLALGTGGAALVAAGAFELLRRDAESEAQTAHYQPDYYEERDRMRSRQTTARVLLGVSAVLLVSGGVLALIDGAKTDATPAPIALGCDATTCLGTWTENF